MLLHDPEKKTDYLRWAAFIVACCAFAFQIFVLYPWHIELSNEFKKLSRLVLKQ